MSARLKLFFSGFGVFFLFVLFSYLVHKDVFMQFDFNATVRLQDNISRWFDDIFSFLSDVGHFEVMLITLIGFFIIIRKWLAGCVAFVLFGIFHVIELFGKFFVNHPPPPFFMIRTRDIVEFPQFHVSAEFSYPSGHAGRTAFISVIFLIFILTHKKISKRTKLVLCGVIGFYNVAMFVSRIYLGEHWATDVIGGALLGISFGMISGVLLLRKPNSSK